MDNTVWQIYETESFDEDERAVLVRFMKETHKIAPLLFLKQHIHPKHYFRDGVLIVTEWGDGLRALLLFLQSSFVSDEVIPVLRKGRMQKKQHYFIKLKELEFVVSHNYVPVPNMSVDKIIRSTIEKEGERGEVLVTLESEQITIPFIKSFDNVNGMIMSSPADILNLGTLAESDSIHAETIFRTFTKYMPLFCLRDPMFDICRKDIRFEIDIIRTLLNMKTVLFIDTSSKWETNSVRLKRMFDEEELMKSIEKINAYFKITVRDEHVVLNDVEQDYLLFIPFISKHVMTYNFVPILNHALSNRTDMSRTFDRTVGIIELGAVGQDKPTIKLPFVKGDVNDFVKIKCENKNKNCNN